MAALTKSQKKAQALARKQRRLCARGTKQEYGGVGAPVLTISTLPVTRFSIIPR